MPSQSSKKTGFKTDSTTTDNRSISKRLTVVVPGSTANLGPGFDALALALAIYSRFTFELLEEDDGNIPLITLIGGIAQHLPADQNNLVYQIFRDQWQAKPDLLKRIRITITSDIPLARGLGSSAAAILGALFAADVLSGGPPDRKSLLSKATAIEGHADNLAASLLGGLVICASSERSPHIVTQRLTWPEDWHTLVVVPGYALSTKKAREVLPKQISMKDAVYNIQKTALLISAISHQDEDALCEALHDKLHEPYREPLVPELALLKRQLSNLPTLGCVLSGAGSSILVIVNKVHKKEVLEYLSDWSVGYPDSPQILDLKIDHRGLHEIVD